METVDETTGPQRQQATGLAPSARLLLNDFLLDSSPLAPPAHGGFQPRERRIQKALREDAARAAGHRLLCRLTCGSTMIRSPTMAPEAPTTQSAQDPNGESFDRKLTLISGNSSFVHLWLWCLVDWRSNLMRA